THVPRRGRCSRRSVWTCRSFSFPWFGSVVLVVLTLLVENGAVNSALDLEVGRCRAIAAATGGLNEPRHLPDMIVERPLNGSIEADVAAAGELERRASVAPMATLNLRGGGLDDGPDLLLVELGELYAHALGVESGTILFGHDLAVMASDTARLVAESDDHLIPPRPQASPFPLLLFDRLRPHGIRDNVLTVLVGRAELLLGPLLRRPKRPGATGLE